MPKRLPLHNLDPELHPDGEVATLIGGKAVWARSTAGVPTFLLDLGQTVADYETANGITLPVPCIIARKTS